MYTIDKGFLSIFEWFTCHWDFLSHFKTSHYNQPFHLLIQVLSYPWLHFLALSINWTFPLCKLAINFNMIVVLFHGKHKTLLMFFVSILWHISHSLPLSTPPSHSLLALTPSLSCHSPTLVEARSHSSIASCSLMFFLSRIQSPSESLITQELVSMFFWVLNHCNGASSLY